MMDIAKLEIKTDENFVYEDGTPRKDAEIYEDHILCHPKTEEKMREALKLFFIPS